MATLSYVDDSAAQMAYEKPSVYFTTSNLVPKEGDDVEARPEVGVLLEQMALDGSQMVVVSETVKVDEHFDPVTLINEAGGEVLSRQLLTGLQLDP